MKGGAIMFKTITEQVVSNRDLNSIDCFYQKMKVILFRTIVFLIAPLMLFGSIFYFRDGEPFYAVIEVLVAVFLIVFIFFDGPNAILKQHVVLVTLVVISFFVLLTTGIQGGGVTSLITSSMFIFLMVKETNTFKYYIGLIITSLGMITLFLYMGVLDDLPIKLYQETWPFMMVLLSTYLIGLYVIVSIYKQTIESQYILVRKSETFLTQIINGVNIAIITTDIGDQISYCNDVARKLFGQSLVDKRFTSEIKPKLTPYEISFASTLLMKRTLVSYQHNERESILIIDKSDMTDEVGKIIGHVIVLEDVTHILNTEQELEYISEHDLLTRLNNRMTFEKQLRRFDVEQNYPLSIAMLDINGLRLINESFGHKVGDQLIISLAQVLKSIDKEGIEIARIGGDEFAMLLPKTSYKEADDLVSSVQDKSQTIVIKGIELSFSAGIATKIDKKQSIDDVYKLMENNLLKAKKFENNSLQSKTIDLIMLTLYEKNKREMRHSERVGNLSERLAKELGLPNNDIKRIRLAALMHDIGKIAIEEQILNKESNLTESEWQRVKQHAEIGYRLLNSNSDFEDIAQYVLEHHEHYDGLGYPKGLKGKEIKKEARIISIADAFDAMTGFRTYKKSLSIDQAVDQLLINKGKQFDPDFVDVFIEKVIKYKKEI
jgi:diguanylate cyclase (GGDEF)-like protein/putative nucleotidyltransferase with HDIG domain/PAS domain S-box-containing protein